MIALMGNGLLATEAVDLARQWETLNYVRHAIVLAAWLLSLKAFAVFHREGRVLI
jgi:hypothetical protein